MWKKIQVLLLFWRLEIIIHEMHWDKRNLVQKKQTKEKNPKYVTFKINFKIFILIWKIFFLS